MKINHEAADIANGYYFAIKKNDIGELRALLAANEEACTTVMPYDESLLYHAVVENREAMAGLLLEKGCDPDAQNKDGYSCLHITAIYGFPDIARLLIAHKATLDIEDRWGNTPLMMAVKQFTGDAAVIRLLAEHGADPRRLNKSGNSALILARDAHWEELVHYFSSIP